MPADSYLLTTYLFYYFFYSTIHQLSDGSPAHRNTQPPMLTIFTAAKPFRGRTATIQRNALHSWMQLHDDVQIILFGDAAGTQEVAWELGLHYEASPQLTTTGAVRLDYMLATARRYARHNVLCFVACDILLQRDLCDALNRVEALHHEFVMVGRAGTNRTEDAVAYTSAEAANGTARNLQATSSGSVSEKWHPRLDYVIFSRNCFVSDVPGLPANSPFAAKWLMRRAMANEVQVVDASRIVGALKQIELESGRAAIVETPAACRNVLCAEEKQVLFGEYGHLLGMMRAPYLLTSKDIVANRWLGIRMGAGLNSALLSRMWQGLKAQLRKPHEFPAPDPLLGVDILRASQRRP